MGYKYSRILLKLSGEALMGNRGYGIDRDVVQTIALEVAEVARDGVEVAIVVGEATSSAGCREPPRAWTEPPPTILA